MTTALQALAPLRCLSAVALLCILVSPSLAAVRYVDDTVAGGANNGTSWGNAYADLQDALGASASPDQIWVAGGTYYPTDGTVRTVSFVLLPGVSLYGGFAGTETAPSQRLEANPASVLSGDIGVHGDDSDNANTVVYAPNTAGGALVDGFTITKGRGASRGGGLLVYATITVRDCIIEDNVATEGGGIQNGFYGNQGNPNYPSSSTYDRCIIRNNQALGQIARAGGFQNHSPSSTATVQNCLFSGNSAVSGNNDGRGGALALYHGAITMRNCTFANNSATSYAYGAYLSNGGRPLFVNCILWDTGDSGGGIYIKNETVAGNVDPFCEIRDSDVRNGFVPPAGQGSGVNIHNVDPQFVNAAGGDCHLQETSPCRELASAAEAPPNDLDGGTRPYGAGYDLGAYEYGSLFTVTTTSTSTTSTSTTLVTSSTSTTTTAPVTSTTSTSTSTTSSTTSALRILEMTDHGPITYTVHTDEFANVYTAGTMQVTGVELGWPSQSGRQYRVYGTTNLAGGALVAVTPALPATPPQNVYTASPALGPPQFFVIGEESP